MRKANLIRALVFIISFIILNSLIGCGPPKFTIVGKWSFDRESAVLIFKADGTLIVQTKIIPPDPSNNIPPPTIPEIPISGSMEKPKGDVNSAITNEKSNSTAKAPQMQEVRYSYTTDMSKTPNWIDIVSSNPPARCEGILRFVDKNTVEIILGNVGYARPASFTNTGDIQTWRRLAE
jgi:hypothetical protein